MPASWKPLYRAGIRTCPNEINVRAVWPTDTLSIDRSINFDFAGIPCTILILQTCTIFSHSSVSRRRFHLSSIHRFVWIFDSDCANVSCSLELILCDVYCLWFTHIQNRDWCFISDVLEISDFYGFGDCSVSIDKSMQSRFSPHLRKSFSFMSRNREIFSVLRGLISFDDTMYAKTNYRKWNWPILNFDVRMQFRMPATDREMIRYLLAIISSIELCASSNTIKICNSLIHWR